MKLKEISKKITNISMNYHMNYLKYFQIKKYKIYVNKV